MIPKPNLKSLTILFLFFFYGGYILGQNLSHDVFPNLAGQSLMDELVKEYKTQRVLNYGKARDTLFALIDNVNDSLECVYTGYKIYLDPEQDPTRAAFQRKINTEHTYPQNKGAKRGKAKSDMHHLYAVRVNVNSTRGNLPFKTISDNTAKKWFIDNQSSQNVPVAERGKYSKWVENFFEPRDEHKGNLARSIFYFYTMYKEQADEADAGFFPLMLEDLCKWHKQDPVDLTEWTRNQRIADYQQGKLNPFILDENLPDRTFCSEGRNNLKAPKQTGDAFPKPYFIELTGSKPNYGIQYFLQNPYQVEIGIYNASGRLLNRLIKEEKVSGFNGFDFEIPEDAKYVYCMLTNGKGSILEKFEL